MEKLQIVLKELVYNFNTKLFLDFVFSKQKKVAFVDILAKEMQNILNFYVKYVDIDKYHDTEPMTLTEENIPLFIQGLKSFLLIFKEDKNILDALKNLEINDLMIEKTIIITDTIIFVLENEEDFNASEKFKETVRELMTKFDIEQESINDVETIAKTSKDTFYFKGQIEALIQIKFNQDKTYSTLIVFDNPNIKNTITTIELFNQQSNLPKNDYDIGFLAKNFSQSGNSYFKSIKNGVFSLIYETPSQDHSTKEIKLNDNVTSKLITIGSSILECGYLDGDKKDYFLQGEVFAGRLQLTINEKGEERAKTTNNLKPFILSLTNVILPYGYSCMPEVITNKIPNKQKFWKISDNKKRIDERTFLKSNLKKLGINFDNLIITEKGLFCFKEQDNIEIKDFNNVGIMIKASVKLKSLPITKEFLLIYNNNNLTKFEVIGEEDNMIFLQEFKTERIVLKNSLSPSIWVDLLEKSLRIEKTKEDDLIIKKHTINYLQDFEEIEKGYLLKSSEYNYKMTKAPKGLWQIKKEKNKQFIKIKVLSKALGKDELTVFGIVLRPNEPDAQGEFYSAEAVRETAENWLMNYGYIGVQHTYILDKKQVGIVQSYIAPVDFKFSESNYQIKQGDWVLITKVLDKKIINGILKDELTGYSIGGMKYF